LLSLSTTETALSKDNAVFLFITQKKCQKASTIFENVRLKKNMTSPANHFSRLSEEL
jgi:hypothetical protein